MRAALSRPCLSAALLVLAACGGSDQAYPRLLPLSDLTAPPAVPVHAADAAADPEAVGEALRARRAEAAARAGATQGPVTDAAGLQARAAALRDRAGQIAAAEPSGGASLTIAPAVAAPTTRTTDPGTDARAEALRERARRMLDGAPPDCPPGAAACPQP
ncbi:hypothetical protein [Paracoccus sp. (in: a-proteobacteria)]|uniref:hypothetical protein n=1 Tax=Paracoccus sp. TaxID=267 RepID=UPI0026E101C1|nr:hypothetical protein [Paracoccus sp. (in: a-proteobacteria)]MDO5370966.1 hypothetical protein [Paracoccus sp. (in: a-proteobacteria)]